MDLQQGFHSLVHCYRVGRRIYAGFRHTSERDAVAEPLKDASDHQGASATPLVVTKIDEKVRDKPAIMYKTRFTFGTAAPDAVPLPPVAMERDARRCDAVGLFSFSRSSEKEEQAEFSIQANPSHP